MYDTIEVAEEHAGIVEITLNRPDSLNAINPQMKDDLCAALLAADDREDVRAVFIAGSGRCFSAGHDTSDLAWLSSATAREVRERLREASAWLDVVWRLRTPVVAVVHGFALGQASELVTRCDLAICSEDATFGWPEVRAGGVPNSMWSVELNHHKLAKEVLMTGRVIGAHEAERTGLVNMVARDGELGAMKDDLARNLAALNPRSLESVKMLVNGLVERKGGLDAAEHGALYNAIGHDSTRAVGYWQQVKEEGSRTAARALAAGAEPYWARRA